jgi:two-component system, chemotaxis family, protein-glutamate methylesterase/glutaminase
VPATPTEGSNGGHDVVVVGASAGGVEALSRLVAELPADLPAAVLIVLHTPPTGMSVLPAILARAGVMTVAHAFDHEPLDPGRIYVAPPDQHLLVEDGHVLVTHGPKENGHRPAIDPLFRTAARAAGSRVVGVILSGTRDDGVAGLNAIKVAGGIAVVQDPADALYPTLPQHAIDGVRPHHVLAIDEIGPLLARLVREPAPANNPGRSRSEPPDPQFDLEQVEQAGDLPGMPSAFTCPLCNGTLWESEEGTLLRYTCRVGHAFSPESLVGEQSEALEGALWSAVRALEERVALLRRLSQRIRLRGGSARYFEQRARAAEEHVDAIRSVIGIATSVSAPVAAEESESP